MRKETFSLRKKAIDFMHSKWAKDCLNNDEIDIDTQNFEKIADRIFDDLTKNKKSSKKPFIFRVGGQSGAGKTTQLLPAIQNVIDNKKNDFINISVRCFSTYHPNYDKLLEEFGSGLIREKTNGFALMMLFRTVEKLIDKKYNILLEVTILDNSFEEYLSLISKYKKYNVHFHILSVPQDKSNYWIEKRKNNSKTEGNRIVLKTSSDFFYEVLPITLKKLINYNFWNKNDKVFLWNGFDFQPILNGKVYKNKLFINEFEKYRKLIDFEEKNEDELLNSKIVWFNNYYKN